MEKKILHIAQSNGGVAEYLYLLLANMSANKYDNVLILSEDYTPQIDRFNKLASKIYLIPMVRDLNLKYDIKAVSEIHKIIKQEKPDIAYLHSSKAGGLARIAMLLNRKIRIIYNAHGWYFNAKISKKKRILYAWIEKILAIKTDMIINISKSEYDSAIKNKIANPKKMCIVENGIDIKKFDNAEENRKQTREFYQIKEDEIVIGVVGRIAEQKDPITFIKAAKIVYDEIPNTKFMYIGAGDLEEEVKKFAKENNLTENVIMTGWVDDVEKYISALDIAVLPSKWEGFGLVILEYMACKKPIIASNLGGIADIIKSEKNGLLVDSGDTIQLSKYMIKYIKDKDLVKDTIEYNYEYVKENYNIDREVQKIEKIFDEEKEWKRKLI